MKRIKFSKSTPADPTGEEPHVWEPFFYREERSPRPRITATMTGESTNLIRDLANCLEEPCAILHVIKVSRIGHPGRYQLKEWLDHTELDQYLNEFSEFLSHDGRHDFWIHSSTGLIVYDRHEILYLYGPLNEFQQLLVSRGYTEELFSIYFAHHHHYNPDFDHFERRLTNSEVYRFSELSETDKDS